ncbi:TRAFs-binding domain-containing protein [Zoogloea sp.]|uniref:TRAFs-binding domain-containing protein n=1 Tax=Zoogloea sp. TaxID=49181 RepID=UPI0035B4675D
MKLHAFVAMPFGTKPDPDGKPIDFNRIYDELLRPALERVGLDVIRADEEQRAGDIRVDMFQELLMADLVLVDLTLDNPNVWYELGVRHALRARGVVLTLGPRGTKPFDIYTDRKLGYRLKDGAPDPDHLAADIAALAEMTRETLEAGPERVVSPVYALLPNLAEPDWKSLRAGAAREFWRHHDDWSMWIERARKAERPEDVLVLAEEAPVTALRVEARLLAGKALVKGRHFNFALEQFEAACRFDPTNLDAARNRGMCLQRIGRNDDARAVYRKILADHPRDVETLALLGRLDKDAWVAAWNRDGSTPEQKRSDAAYEDALLLTAIESYVAAFRAAPGHYYSGINALTLIHLYRDLTGQPSPYDAQLDCMAGGVSWATGCELLDNNTYWGRATLGDLAVLCGDTAGVTRAYKDAIALADKDWFSLDSTLGQLRVLQAIGFAPERVAAGIATFERALDRLQKPADSWKPEKVFLFSGHMIDAPGRKQPRFPADKEPVAAAAIAQALDDLGASAADLALTQGASGGDILFAEAAIARGLRVQFLFPLPEPDFIAESVLPATNGDAWRKRFLKLREHPLCQPPRTMPDELGPLPCDSHGNELNPYERCNLWLLNSALACGIKRTRFVCLWNGGGGDGPGGTQHLVEEVKRRTGQVTWLDTRTMW